MTKDLIPSDAGEFVLYQTEDGRTRVQVRVEADTVWLTQRQMAELFQKDVRTISEHTRNIFSENELEETAVVRSFRITAADGKQYATQHYNLDVIISVGYRVKSLCGTQFRIWATQRLREYILKGFATDDDRLKAAGRSDYFDFAELQALSRRPMHMADWITKLDDFVRISGREILTHAGRVSHDAAKRKAETEFAAFRAARVNLPQPVDEHFARAIEELGRIESQVKHPGGDAGK